MKEIKLNLACETLREQMQLYCESDFASWTVETRKRR
jgi:hypothetical protein